jgi:hypothetical protein
MTAEDNSCPVCLVELGNCAVHVLECGHSYHTHCIVKWFRSGSPQCPICRSAGSDTEASSSECETSQSEYEDIENEIHSMNLGQLRLTVRPYIRASRFLGCPRNLKAAVAVYQRADIAMKESKIKVADYRRRSNGPFAPLHKRYITLVKSKNTKEVRFRTSAFKMIEISSTLLGF